MIRHATMATEKGSEKQCWGKTNHRASSIELGKSGESPFQVYQDCVRFGSLREPSLYLDNPPPPVRVRGFPKFWHFPG